MIYILAQDKVTSPLKCQKCVLMVLKVQKLIKIMAIEYLKALSSSKSENISLTRRPEDPLEIKGQRVLSPQKLVGPSFGTKGHKILIIFFLRFTENRNFIF